MTIAPSFEPDWPPLLPHWKSLAHYLSISSRLVGVSVRPELLEAAANDARLTCLAAASPLELSASPESARDAVILIGADVFDPDASWRLSEVRQIVGKDCRSYLFAVTSYMPGAYREFTQAGGADDCLTESGVLLSLRTLR